MHHGTPQKYRNRPTRANYALWNVAWSPRVLDIWEKRSKTADSDRRPWGTIKKHFQTLGTATINRYFEVGTIIRINRLKPVNCSTKFITVALIKFASIANSDQCPSNLSFLHNPTYIRYFTLTYWKLLMNPDLPWVRRRPYLMQQIPTSTQWNHWSMSVEPKGKNDI